MIRAILLICIGSLLNFPINAQTQLFEKYDFSQGGYVILGVLEHSDKNSLKDSLGAFYTDDTAVLNRFKSSFVFSESSPKYACGFHYNLLLCKDGKKLESFYINLNCNEISSPKGEFLFNSNLLRQFYGLLKPLKKELFKFTSLDSARQYMINLDQDSHVLYYRKPIWSDYQGEFDFSYIYSGNESIDDNDSLLPQIYKTIAEAFPGEHFNIVERGGSLREIDLTIYCNKSLEEKFDLYERDTNAYPGIFREFPLMLLVYFKD